MLFLIPNLLIGSFYSCSHGTCLPCPRDTYQPIASETTCWPCPVNTSTDTSGQRWNLDFWKGKSLILPSLSLSRHPKGCHTIWQKTELISYGQSPKILFPPLQQDLNTCLNVNTKSVVIINTNTSPSFQLLIFLETFHSSPDARGTSGK